MLCCWCTFRTYRITPSNAPRNCTYAKVLNQVTFRLYLLSALETLNYPDQHPPGATNSSDEMRSGAHPAAPRACSLLAPLRSRRNPGCWKLPQAWHCPRGVARKSWECRECWLLQTSRVSLLQEQAPHSLTAHSLLCTLLLAAWCLAVTRVTIWPCSLLLYVLCPVVTVSWPGHRARMCSWRKSCPSARSHPMPQAAVSSVVPMQPVLAWASHRVPEGLRRRAALRQRGTCFTGCSQEPWALSAPQRYFPKEMSAQALPSLGLRVGGRSRDPRMPGREGPGIASNFLPARSACALLRYFSLGFCRLDRTD